ncbi:MAG: hypothetical protein H7831_10300 [Magnetococcus sp. WYHC-3]
MSATAWDLRWPDPVALQVASERQRETCNDARPGVNMALPVLVQVEQPFIGSGWARFLLASPWGVACVWYPNPAQTEAVPVRSAFPLNVGPEGRVLPGQGVLLDTAPGQTIPALTAWAPETGHHFVQLLIRNMEGFSTAPQALEAARKLQNQTPERPVALSRRMEKPVSRRGLLSLFRS